MFYIDQILVGLEIGTSKVCVVVGEVVDSGNISIIGVGQEYSQGVRKGEIVDMDAVTDSIQKALAEAEESAGVEIHNVTASVTGGHLRSFNNRGSVAVMDDEREISNEDIQNVLRNAKSVSIPVDHHVVHAIRQRFYVDGHEGIENPAGLVGSKLEADVHVIYGVRSRFQNTIKCVRQIPLEIQGVAASGFASALAVLTSEHQHLGSLLIDIGGGITDYVVYREGTVQHSGVLAVGGDHITNDIAVGLKIPMNRAEQLKIDHGSAEWPIQDEAIRLKREVGLPDRQLSKDQLCQIIHLRVKEIFTLVKKELEAHQLSDYMGAGVFVTGGSCRLRGLESLASSVFELPVHVGHSHAVGGPTSAIESPEYSTAIGLIRYALHSQKDNQQQGQGIRHLTGKFQQGIMKMFRSFA